MKNIALSISTIVLIACVSGCGGSLVTRWRGPAGHGERNPIETSVSSTDEYRQCRESSLELRRELLHIAGLDEACEDCEHDDTIAVPARTLARTACMGRPEEERDACVASLLEHVSPDTELTLGGVRRADDADASDPLIRQIRLMVAMNPAIYRDDIQFCTAWASTYGAFGTGVGLGGGLPITAGGSVAVGGTVPGLSIGLLGSTVGVPGSVGGTVPGLSAGTVSFYYPVHSYLPRNVYAQVQIATAATGVILGSVVVGNVDPSVAGRIVTPSVTVPLTVPRGTPVTITWVCVDASGANPSHAGSITGPADLGLNLNPTQCGLPSYSN